MNHLEYLMQLVLLKCAAHGAHAAWAADLGPNRFVVVLDGTAHSVAQAIAQAIEAKVRALCPSGLTVHVVAGAAEEHRGERVAESESA